MDRYAELLCSEAYELSPDEDDYEEKLLKIAAQFRGFPEALTAFLTEHGYKGDPSDASAKEQFLKEKCQEAGIKAPRDMKKWFVPGRNISRESAYQICFAFGLDAAQTNEFFRCVQFERGFDCHVINEAVYYFCMRNDLSYADARNMITRIPIPGKTKTLPEHEILYTDSIIRYIDRIHDGEILIRYINNHIKDFRYHNATAVRYIQELWTGISGKDGLAEKEGAVIDRTRNRYARGNDHGNAADSPADMTAGEIRRREQVLRAEDYVVAGPDSSTWTIFSQILGLPNYLESEYARNHDRSLAPVLNRNPLLPLNAASCFPSRQGIDRFLRGESGDNEMVRKMLIFLVFYSYWAKIIIRENDPFYLAKNSDSERCLATVNGRLSDAGYPELYAGNPYDWLFLWSIQNEHPLDAFRTFIGEVFAVKSEQKQQ